MSSQYVRYPLEKRQFWHGIMTVNDNLITSFFDVKVKRDVPDSQNMIGLFTDDLPAVPVSTNDTIQVVFNLENNVGTTPVRNKVVETTFRGSDIWNKCSENPENHSVITIPNDVGEWSFLFQETVWVIKSFLVYVPSSQLKKHITTSRDS